MNNSVIILRFSPRNGGNCAKISEYVRQFHKTNTQVISIGKENFAPCGNCDYECLKPDVVCPNLSESERQILDTLCQCKMAYFIVPNFCGYPCANYFAFNERTVGYFNGDRAVMEQYMNVPKRFIIVSNTEGFEEPMGQQTNDKPKILYMRSGKYKKHSIAGDLLDCAEARAELDAFLASDPL